MRVLHLEYYINKTTDMFMTWIKHKNKRKYKYNSNNLIHTIDLMQCYGTSKKF